jgi:hypothetical protein
MENEIPTAKRWKKAISAFLFVNVVAYGIALGFYFIYGARVQSELDLGLKLDLISAFWYATYHFKFWTIVIIQLAALILAFANFYEEDPYRRG